MLQFISLAEEPGGVNTAKDSPVEGTNGDVMDTS
jgi:hypothetical protein